ncbi:MAG TPA: cytochrome c [Thermoanaerobaculia bacterium]|nr:cytochrome c [Thermoanaerobaculia bacterium]
MKVPVSLRIAALAVATTSFYTYVGQLVPQKEVRPPAEVAISKDMKPEEMAKVGREIMEGKGLCFTCHTVGKSGALRFPDLQGIGARAGSRRPGLTDVQYLAQSIYEPSAFIVPGFNPGMPVINKPPIGLTDDEILAVIAYLQTLGGKTTVTMQTKLPYQAGGGGGQPADASVATGEVGGTGGTGSLSGAAGAAAPVPQVSPAKSPETGAPPQASKPPGKPPGSDR